MNIEIHIYLPSLLEFMAHRFFWQVMLFFIALGISKMIRIFRETKASKAMPDNHSCADGIFNFQGDAVNQQQKPTP